MLTVYTKSNCPNCVQAKNILASQNVEYKEINVDENDKAKEFLLSQGHRSMPQIYKGGNLFVENGHLGLLKLLRLGQLK